MVYSNAEVYMVENEYGKSGHLSFTSLNHLMFLKCTIKVPFLIITKNNLKLWRLD